MPMLAATARDLAAALTITALLIAALVLGREILVPFALATILAFMLAPLVRFLHAYRVPRGMAVGVAVAMMVIGFVGASATFSAQLLSLTASLSNYKDNLTNKVQLITGSQSGGGVLGRAADSIEILEKAFKTEPKRPAGEQSPIVVAPQNSRSGALLEQLRGALGPLAGLFLTVLFAGFLLAQYHDIRDRVVRLAGTDNMTATTSAISEAGSRLSKLFVKQAILNASFGLFVTVALAIIGVPSAILWGVATMFLRFIPFVGSFLSAIPPILLAAAVDPGWGMMIATFALFAIGEPIVGHVIEPLVLGKGVGLSPFAMVAAASFWTLVWGPIGLLLAAPLTMCIVVLGQYIPRLEFMSVLLGNTPALDPAQEFYHRILSDDTAAAAGQYETAAELTSTGSAADEIVLPALRLAARDHRTDRLDAKHVEAMRGTMDGVIEFAAEMFGSRANAGEMPNRERQQVVVIPARGPVDTLAAVFVCTIIERCTGRRCTPIQQASGLLALSTARAMEENKEGRIGAVVLSTVGGMDRQHLRLLAKRAARDFPGASLLLCDWGAAAERHPDAADDVAGSRETVAGKLTSVIEVLAATRADDAEPAKRAASSPPDPAITIAKPVAA